MQNSGNSYSDSPGGVSGLSRAVNRPQPKEAAPIRLEESAAYRD